MISIHIKILKINVYITSYPQVVKQIISWAESRCPGKYVCVANVHMCMEAYDFSKFCRVVNDADLVVPDGKPLVWAQRLMGKKDASQVRGSDLLLKLSKEAETKKIPIGLYGGTENSLADFMKFLTARFPDLKIHFAASPPFRDLTETEDKKYIEDINASGTKILFVGIGCPKQEKWMANHKSHLNCVMIGVGAAFDFFSGRKNHAPRWMQEFGLEWLFRFASDPRRLWKRYLKHNPRFIYYLLKQIMCSRRTSLPKP